MPSKETKVVRAARYGDVFIAVSLGRPEQLHASNGMTHEARLVTDGCSAWGIDVSRTSANRPRYRSRIERFFKIREAEPDEVQRFTTDFLSKIPPKGRKR